MFEPLRTLVIGTSLSATSDDVVRTGAAIARATGATAWLVHTYTLPAFPSELGTMDGAWIEEYIDSLRERLAQQAQRMPVADWKAASDAILASAGRS